MTMEQILGELANFVRDWGWVAVVIGVLFAAVFVGIFATALTFIIRTFRSIERDHKDMERRMGRWR